MARKTDGIRWTLDEHTKVAQATADAIRAGAALDSDGKPDFLAAIAAGQRVLHSTRRHSTIGERLRLKLIKDAKRYAKTATARLAPRRPNRSGADKDETIEITLPHAFRDVAMMREGIVLVSVAAELLTRAVQLMKTPK